MKQHEIEYTNCVKCGMPIPKSAKICPHCKEEQPGDILFKLLFKLGIYFCIFIFGVIIGTALK